MMVDHTDNFIDDFIYKGVLFHWEAGIEQVTQFEASSPARSELVNELNANERAG